MAGDGSSTGDGALEGRMNLLVSKVDSKIFFHKDAMMEYMEMKHLMSDIAEKKARMEQEALRRESPELLAPVLEQLAAVREELAATKEALAAREEELAVTEEELAATKEELAVAKKERDEKDEELKATIAKAREFEALKNQYEQQSASGVALDSDQDQPSKKLACRRAISDDDLEGLRETLIKEFMQIDCGGRVLGVKEMGRLDEKPFHAACAAKLPPKEAKKEASKLYTTWEKLLKNPSWKPFKTDAVGDNSQEETLDVDDDMLQVLKSAWGEGVYNAVVRALMEMKEYNPLSNRSITYELWNYKAGRKATMMECVEYMSNQVKQLSTFKRMKTRRSAGIA